MKASFKTLKLAGVMAILLIIALASTWLIIQPVKTHIPVYDKFGEAKGEVVETPTLMDGTSEAWKEYPEYNIGLGVIAVMSFTGFILTCSTMCNEKEGESG